MNWQPIETAPKDGTEIILYNGNDISIGYFASCGYDNDDRYQWIVFDADIFPGMLNGWPNNEHGPTHWMPLPEPPK